MELLLQSMIVSEYKRFFCISQASADMEEIFLFIDHLNKRLARGIKDLDDVRSSMAALSEIRESEIRFVLHVTLYVCACHFSPI